MQNACYGHQCLWHGRCLLANEWEVLVVLAGEGVVWVAHDLAGLALGGDHIAVVVGLGKPVISKVAGSLWVAAMHTFAC